MTTNKIYGNLVRRESDFWAILLLIVIIIGGILWKIIM